jgi:hypothetical protein
MKTLILFAMLLGTTAQAAFSDTNTRYLSGHEVVAKLVRLFPGSQMARQASNEGPPCSLDKTSTAGENDPITGKSIYMEPGPAFLKWYTSCIEEASRNEFYGNDPTILKFHLGALTANFTFATPASRLNDSQLKELIEYTMIRILGPDEVVMEYGYIDDCDKFREELGTRINRNSSVGELLKSLEFELITRDEFLSY